MIRTLKHTWNDPVTRWELRYLESQHRKPRRWWLALVALPGITAAVLFACHYEPDAIRCGAPIKIRYRIALISQYTNVSQMQIAIFIIRRRGALR